MSVQIIRILVRTIQFVSILMERTTASLVVRALIQVEISTAEINDYISNFIKLFLATTLQCTRQACGEFGTCHNSNDGKAYCKCDVFYKYYNGTCQSDNKCSQNPCGANGACQTVLLGGIVTYTCNCNIGKLFSNCQTETFSNFQLNDCRVNKTESYTG